MSLMDYFPGVPRAEQTLVIDRIDKAFEEGKKYIICQAPTGSGKSHIGATLALSTKDAPDVIKKSLITPRSQFRFDADSSLRFGGYILTTSKQLQDQYKELFPSICSLKGKINYNCDLDPLSNAACAKCCYLRGAMDVCATKGNCEYINAYSDLAKSKFAVLNYNMFLALPQSMRQKNILICDEASELEDTLVSTYSFSVKYSYLDFLKIPYTKLKRSTPEDGFLWVAALYNSITEEIPSQARIAKSPNNKKLQDKATKLRDMAERLKLLHNYWHSSEFIVEQTSEEVKISPLKVNKLASLMFETADKVILMSATIINHAKFADTLGIKQSEYEFIDVQSNFNPKKSPIYVAPAKYDMTYKNIDRDIGALVSDVVELCGIHKEDNGVIHTHSFKITQAIKERVGGDPRFLFRDKYSSNEDILREHFYDPTPTVLVSPSLAYGTSLDNEHGRFQIITKMPYLPMRDKRVKLLCDKDFNWYQMKMWITMIQMCGRCTRSSDDHSKTYIFDKSFISAYSRYVGKLPKWFTARLV